MAFLISLQNCKIIAPNCGGGASIQAVFTFTDRESNTGTATLNGTKNAINAINDTVYLEIDGVAGADTINTTFGVVNVAFAFGGSYNVNRNVDVKMDVLDCMGWANVDSAFGKTNALMTHTNNYIKDDNDNYIAFV